MNIKYVSTNNVIFNLGFYFCGLICYAYWTSQCISLGLEWPCWVFCQHQAYRSTFGLVKNWSWKVLFSNHRCCRWGTMFDSYKSLPHPTEIGRAPFIHFQKMFLKKSYCRPNSVNDSNFMPGSWHLVKNVKKGQKNVEKSQKLCVKTRFSNFVLSWLIWNTSIAIKWWKKIGVII